MMRLDLFDFEDDLDEDIIDEAETLELDEVRCASDGWTAKVGQYRTSLKVDPEQEVIYDVTCKCGSDMAICEHVAALAMRVRKHYKVGMILDEDLEGDVDFDIAKRVLKKLNKKELLEIATEYVEYGDILARNLTVRYLKNDGDPLKYAMTFCTAIMNTIKVDLTVSESQVRDTKVGFAAIRVLGDQALEVGRKYESVKLQSICLEYLAQADLATSSPYTEAEIELVLERFERFLEMGEENEDLLNAVFKGVVQPSKYFREDSPQLVQLIRMLFPFCGDEKYAFAVSSIILHANSLTEGAELLEEVEEISGL
ncbi:MAG: hypothetical protein LBT59_22490, partial [Clostridiales bacterium]|nr:hypothetical protein [Clostridiales bacterium]